MRQNTLFSIRVGTALVILAMTVAGGIIPIPSVDPQLGAAGPSWNHPLGVSPYGHDMLLLTIRSALRTASQATWAAGLTVTIAIAIGMTAALRRNGLFDGLQAIAARVLDSLGVFLIAVCLATLANRLTIWQLSSALALVAWPNLSHTIRAEALAALDRPYVEAARAIGVPPVRMVLVYLLPDMLDRVLPTAVAMIGAYMGVFGALQFLGVGITDEMSLGFMVYDGMQNFLRSAPWYFAASFAGFVGALAAVAALAAAVHGPSRQPAPPIRTAATL